MKHSRTGRTALLPPLLTDAEVLQEILHRYVAINRRDAIQPAFDALLASPTKASLSMANY